MASLPSSLGGGFFGKVLEALNIAVDSLADRALVGGREQGKVATDASAYGLAIRLGEVANDPEVLDFDETTLVIGIAVPSDLNEPLHTGALESYFCIRHFCCSFLWFINQRKIG
jgi:hypothetical protein